MKVTLSESKEAYYDATNTVSEINRKLAFTGIALIWLFKETSSSGYKIESELILPALFIITSLSFDLIQYIYKSIFWVSFYHSNLKDIEGKNNSGDKYDKEVQVSKLANYPTWFFFIVKVLFTVLAYIVILSYLFEKIS